ncbi:ATP-binding protein [Edaphobacter sp. HDX4]|uniref:ATP-binding response regulator n=1 Tax=Edaphobacter sp. HDX4 TaxID=2794064 RepID=UPI002FE57F83
MSRVLVIGTDNPITHEIGDALSHAGVPVDYAAGPVGALQRLRLRSFGVVVTSPNTSIQEDIALLEEMRFLRPAVKCIVLAPHSTADEVIAALRARVFACYTAPFDPQTIANFARVAASDSHWHDAIEVVTAKPGWVTVRANCTILTGERLLTFINELSLQLAPDLRLEMLQALHEILMNAMEHGAAFNPEQVVEISAVRTARAYVFYLRDPGSGFRPESVSDIAMTEVSQDPVAHIDRREREGLRPGGYGLLLARGTVNELIYSELGNEVLLIKYTKGN